jgi:hypothetical protein
MPPHSVVARLGAIMSGTPSVLGANRVRAARPAVVTELPSLVVDFNLSTEGTVSRVRFVREGRPGVAPRHTERLGGVMGVEVWAATAPDLLALSEKVQDRLAESTAIRGSGMVVLRASACGAGEGLMHTPPGTAAFAAWRQRLEYTFEYDGETEVVETEGAPIKRIDVTMDSALPDHLTIGQ